MDREDEVEGPISAPPALRLRCRLHWPLRSVRCACGAGTPVRKLEPGEAWQQLDLDGSDNQWAKAMPPPAPAALRAMDSSGKQTGGGTTGQEKMT